MEHNKYDLLKYRDLVQSKVRENKLFFKQLKKWSEKSLDENFHNFHEEVFEKFDCLSCANCCITTSPRLFSKDVEQMAAALKIRPAEFMEKYVMIDEDNDYVFQSTPCPFLGQDNYCSIYEHRPKACREYPHTNRKKMHQVLSLTYTNISICPAVFQIIERLKSVVKP